MTLRHLSIGIHPNRHNDNSVVSIRHAIDKTLIDILHHARTQNIVIALMLQVLGLMLVQYHTIQFLIYRYWSRADQVFTKLINICGVVPIAKSITILHKSNFHNNSSKSTINDMYYEVLRFSQKVTLSKLMKNQEN